MAADQGPQKASKEARDVMEKATTHFLVKLKLDKKSVPENLVEWSQGVKDWMDATNRSWVAKEKGCVQVPDDQVHRVQLQIGAANMYRHKEQTVKKEEDDSGKESGENEVQGFTMSEYLQTIARRTAENEDLNEEKDTQEKGVYFVDTTLVCTDEEKEFLSKKGFTFAQVKIPGIVKKIVAWCPVETKEKREARFLVWYALVESLTPALDRKLWHHIMIGNCWGLIQFITNRFGQDREEQQSEKWYARLESLSANKEKGFDLFVAEVNRLYLDADTLGITLDPVHMRSKIRDALVRGGNEEFLDEWVTALRFENLARTADPAVGRWEIEKILGTMRTGIVTKENIAKTMKPVKGSSDLQKEVDELKKKILRLSAGGQSEKAKKRGGERPTWAGVCEGFQRDKCVFANCRLKHIKLNSEEKEKLSEWVKNRRERNTKQREGAAGAGGKDSSKKSCLNCGKEGHLADACWGKKGQARNVKAIKKALVDLLQGQDFEELLQEAKLMAKVQVRAEESE